MNETIKPKLLKGNKDFYEKLKLCDNKYDDE